LKRWAILVVVLYAVILAWLLILGVPAAMGYNPIEVLKALPTQGDLPAFAVWGSWVLVMTLCQVGLLVVPVRLADDRPVKQRHVIWPILVGIFSLMGMALTMGLALYEFLTKLDAIPWLFAALATVSVIWTGWLFLFIFYAGRREPKTFMSRLVRVLIGGSILELLVVIPTHIYCRMRDHCCGGQLTIWGLGLGVSVMLFAFGPAVFVLFLRRWQSLQDGRRR
jgi:hypothetical protein